MVRVDQVVFSVGMTFKFCLKFKFLICFSHQNDRVHSLIKGYGQLNSSEPGLAAQTLASLEDNGPLRCCASLISTVGEALYLTGDYGAARSALERVMITLLFFCACYFEVCFAKVKKLNLSGSCPGGSYGNNCTIVHTDRLTC